MKEQYILVTGAGHKYYYSDREMTVLHREDGPAIEHPNGTKQWLIFNKYHREDGPAIENPNGAKQWFLDGGRHREDGPAIIWEDGTKEWYLKDKCMTEEEHIGATKKTHNYTEVDNSVTMYDEITNAELVSYLISNARLTCTIYPQHREIMREAARRIEKLEVQAK